MSHEVLIPAPNESHLIKFPFNLKTKKYDSSFYRQASTNGIASHEEIDHVLREIEKVRKPFDYKIFKWTIVIVLLLIGFSFMYSIFVNQKMDQLKQDPHEKYEFYFGYILLFYVAAFALYLLQVSKLKDERLFKVQAVIYRYNQEFLSQGLRWYIPDQDLYSIQLYKEYEIQDHFDPERTYAIFYFNPDSKAFLSDFYSPELTDCKISTEEIRQILAEFALFREAHERKMISRYAIILGFWVIIAIITYLLFAADFERKRKTDEELFTSSGFLFLIVALLKLAILGVVGVVFTKMRKIQSSRCQSEIEKQNRRLASRGLKWQVPFSFMERSIQWVELVRISRIRNSDLELTSFPIREI